MQRYGFTTPCATLIALAGPQSIPLQLVPVVVTGFAATLCYRALFSLETRKMVLSAHG